MKKILLVLSLFFAASLAQAAGDPVPGIGVSGVYHAKMQRVELGIHDNQSDCIKKGGTIVQENGKTYCSSNRAYPVNTHSGEQVVKRG